MGQVIPGGALEDKLIGGLFLTCMATSDRYFPALMRVMFGGSTPADAVYLSELDVHSAAIESGAASSAPAKSKPRSPAKKQSSRRKAYRNKSNAELPRIIDTPTGDSTAENGNSSPA